MLFLVLLYRTPTEPLTLLCDYMNGTTETADFSTISARETARQRCHRAMKISLVNESVLHINSPEYSEDFLYWLAKRVTLEICVTIEKSRSSIVYVSISYLTGDCKGPKLTFFDNPYLKELEVSSGFLKGMKLMPNAFRVRGNKMLEKVYIDELKQDAASHNVTIDLQTFGECALPNPFASFEVLDRTCNKYYGVLTLRENTTEIQYDPTKVHDFEVEACIQIEYTNLKDVTFLNAFSKFKSIPLCLQYIRNNKNLCSKNLNYFNVYFKTVEISENMKLPCNECMGGPVTEHYLSESLNCSYIYGDLRITHLRGLPPNIGNLRAIETIEGRLIIANNTGLGNFTYLSSLKEVGIKAENSTAVTVKDNADLRKLFLPKLASSVLKERNRRFEFINNPMLAGEMSEDIENRTAELLQTVMEQAIYPGKNPLTNHFGESRHKTRVTPTATRIPFDQRRRSVEAVSKASLKDDYKTTLRLYLFTIKVFSVLE